MKKKKIIIGAASVIALVVLIIIIGYVVHLNNTKLERTFTKLATEYYEGEPKKYSSDIISRLGYFMVSLNDLKNFNKDVSLFEEHSCDLTDTYAKLTFKEDNSYDVEVHLACED